MTSPISRGAYTHTSPNMGTHTKVAYGIAPPKPREIRVMGLSKKSTIVETSNTRLLSGDNTPFPPGRFDGSKAEIEEVNSETQTGNVANRNISPEVEMFNNKEPIVRIRVPQENSDEDIDREAKN